MTHTINVRITDQQAEKIKQSGYTYSKFVRQAIDFYDVQRYNAYINSKSIIILECIKILESHYNQTQNKLSSELYNKLQNVKNTDENNLYKKRDNVKNLYRNDENVNDFVKKNQCQNLYKSEENVNKLIMDPLYPTLKPYLKLLSKMFNLHNTIPKDTKDKIIHETNITSYELRVFLFNYKNEIIQYDYSFSDEIIKHDSALNE